MIRAISNTKNQINFSGIRANTRVSPNNRLRADSSLPLTSKDVFIKSSPISKTFKPNDISFGYNFELKNPSGIPCAYCGKETLSKNEVYHIQDLKGKELVACLEKFASQNRSAMTPQNSGALSLFEKTALDNPDVDGKDLLPIAFTRARTRMLIKQNAVYSQIERLAESINSKELLDYVEKVKDQDVSLNPDISLDELSNFLVNEIHVEFRKDVIRNIEKIADKSSNTDTAPVWNQIIHTIDKLPSSKNDPDAFLVKFMSKAIRKDPKIENELVPLSASSAALFYSTLLFPFVSSAEHIKAYSDDGSSHYSNYLITHAHCNTKRSNTPWSEFMLEDTRRFSHVLNNLEVISNSSEIQESLKKIRVPSYIKQVKNQIENQLSDVRNNPDVKNFVTALSKIGLGDDEDVIFPDKFIKEAVIEKLTPILEMPDYAQRTKALEESLRCTFEDYKNDRALSFAVHINHIEENELFRPLKEYMEELRDNDPILNMDRFDPLFLNKVLNKNYNAAYKAQIQKDLSELYTLPTQNDNLNRIIKNIPRKLIPYRKSDAYYIKTLLGARISENIYNIGELKSIINTPEDTGTSTKGKKRPNCSGSDKFKRWELASAY